MSQKQPDAQAQLKTKGVKNNFRTEIQQYITEAASYAKNLYQIKEMQEKIEKAEWNLDTPRAGLAEKCAATIKVCKQIIVIAEAKLARLEASIPPRKFEFLKIVKKEKLTPLDKRICYYLLAQTMGIIPVKCQLDIATDKLAACITSDGSFDYSESFLYILNTPLEKKLELIHRRSTHRQEFNYEIAPTDKLLKALLGPVMRKPGAKHNENDDLQLNAVFGNNRKKTERKVPEKKIADVILSAEMRGHINKFLWFSKEKDKITWDVKGLGLMSSTALFYGPPGTGKTLLAEAIAGELGLELEKVRYEQLIDCWVGESEKNIKKVFDDNREENRILLFDECDSLLEARQDAQSSVDRMNNRVINILLQELETYPGIIIFTTNRAVKLDPALERRIMLKLEIKRPEKQERENIWRTLTAERIPLAENIGWTDVAAVELSGGEIKNTLLNLAKDPAMHESGRRVTTEDLLRAAREEEKNRFSSEGKKVYGFVIK